MYSIVFTGIDVVQMLYEYAICKKGSTKWSAWGAIKVKARVVTGGGSIGYGHRYLNELGVPTTRARGAV